MRTSMSTSAVSLPVLSALALSAVTSLAAQSPLYSIHGDGADDRFGHTVRIAGDVDGDGHADVIVGAPLDDNNGADSGMARVISGKTGAVLYSFNGQAAGDKFGWAVAGGGDVNGDGCVDLIVGAPLNDSNGVNSGSATVLSGKDGAVLYAFTGVNAGDQFGWAVASAGDVNADGYGDLVVGAPQADVKGAGSGSVMVRSGKDGALLHAFHGDNAGDSLGWSVASAGAANGDQHDDVVAGAPNDDNNGQRSGMVRTFSGSTGAVLWSANGDFVSDRFGYSVSSAGDVSGDGLDDVVAGAPLDDNNGNNSGMARVLSGADGSSVLSVDGDLVDENLGWSVSGGGDVDGDGTPDVVAGSPLHPGGGVDAGRATVWSGATGLRLWTINGQEAGAKLGWQVAVGGDANRDGFADLVVGAPFADNNGADAGSAFIYARAPFDSVEQAITLAPAASPGLFGNDFQRVGDADNDGMDDYAIGAVSDNGAQGVVRLYSSATHTVLHSWPGGTNNIFYGPTIAAAGDIDGDGYDDVLTGAQHWSNPLQYQGRATVRSGRDGSTIWQWFGGAVSDHMGSALGGLGDVNGDGVNDVFVGLLKENIVGAGQGAVRVYSGADGSMLYSVAGAGQGEWFSQRGCPLDDVDGDGVNDFAIGAPQPATPPASQQGYVVVLSGATGAQLHRWNGLSFGDLFGWSVARAGDVNGDGFCDVIVGAQGHDPQGKTQAGMARVFDGATFALLYHYDGEIAGDSFGEAVNGAGDVNGDGYDDFVIGAPGYDPGLGTVIAGGRTYIYSGQDGSLLQAVDGQIFLANLGKANTGVGDINGDGYADIGSGAPQDPTAGAQSGAAYLFESTGKSDPGAHTVYGAPCQGSNGSLPRIGFAGRPVIGQTFDIELANGPASTLATIGFDSGAQNIPLAFIGAPSCSFLALPLIAVNLATDPVGAAKLPLPIPAVASLIGAELYTQWIVRDATANSIGFIFSDGGRISFGTP